MTTCLVCYLLTLVEKGGGGCPCSLAEERLPLYQWTVRMMGLCCFPFFFLIHPLMFEDSYPHPLCPPQLLVVSHVAVMLLLFTTGRLTLIFALPWLSVLCWLLFIFCLSLRPPPPNPLCPSIVLVWPVTIISRFFNIHFDLPSPSPPFPSLPPFLTLVMSALACFGVTNHPLRNLRSKSKHPPIQKSCITIGCWRRPTLPSASSCVSAPWPVLPCPDCRLLLRALSVIGCADGERCSSPKYGLLADRYHFCEKCFNEIQGESVSLGDDPAQPQTWVPSHLASVVMLVQMTIHPRMFFERLYLGEHFLILATKM